MPDRTELEKIEIRSEELEEILGHPPRWIVRSGIWVFSAFVLLLLLGSYLFKYPEKTTPAVIHITSNRPPVKLVAKTSGKIQHLFVANGDKVQDKQALAVLENTSDYQDVVFIRKIIDTLMNNLDLIENTDFFPIQKNLSLGIIQDYYTLFAKNTENYLYYLANNPKPVKLKSIDKELQLYKELYAKQNEQYHIMLQEFEIISAQLQRDSLLLTNGVISSLDYEKSKIVYLQKKYECKSLRISLSNTLIQLNAIERSALETEIVYSEEFKNLKNSLLESINNLAAQIALWEEQFVIKSSINGTVTFAGFWTTNQYVTLNDEIMYVVPELHEHYAAKIQIPIQGSGKVKSGQRVIIKLENYPYMEYGTIEGCVKTISIVPSGEYYFVEVELNNGLRTNYNKNIPLFGQLQGTAEIITSERRMIENLLEPIRAILHNNQ